MNKNLSAIEYEGLEYILSRLIREREYRQGINPENSSNIHSITERTPEGIRLKSPYDEDGIIGDFLIKGIYLQDDTVVLTVYRLEPDSADPAKDELPVYIDMKDFMNTEVFDLDELLQRMARHR